MLPPRRLGTGRLPELTVELALVVFAVLLALAADQCREDRARQQLAREARAKVIEELRLNLDEIETTLPQHERLIEQLSAFAAATVEPDSSNVTYSFAEVSEAAWHAALATQAVHWMDFDWVARVSRAYDRQQMFNDGQRRVLERFGEIGVSRPEDTASLAAMLEGQVRLVIELERSLREQYEAVLRANP